jgi:hypothetical protein
MTRYFFDIIGYQRPELDYTGLLLCSQEKALATAELIAMDLAVKCENEPARLAVRVSSAEGSKLFCVPVRESYLAAA